MHVVRIIYYLDIKEMFNLTSPFDLVITCMVVNKVSRIILVKFYVIGLTKSIIDKKSYGSGIDLAINEFELQKAFDIYNSRKNSKP